MMPCSMSRRQIPLVLMLVLCLAEQALAADMLVTPFRTANRSPQAHIFGIPSETSPETVPQGRTELSLTLDLASTYTVNATPRERIVLDGESYRWTLAARYGVRDRLEAGIEIPFLEQGGGFLDSFIIDWHRIFQLPQGGRDSAPRNRFGYRYDRDGSRRLTMERSGGGIGDISLSAAFTLYEAHPADEYDSLVLRGQLKLPTGDSTELRGSGSTDTTLYLCGGMNRQTEWGMLGVFGSAGAMVLSRGAVLADQQNNLVGVGGAGFGWGPTPWISFKFQINGHTPLYRGSSLTELSSASLMLTSGGALLLPGGYLLDIGVSEDVAVATAPDVTFHLGVSKRF